ncbi:hypothetical protein [Polyangium sp. y55x31]|uniref:hypothetical protein n=1 Tax=Polyangium sp. y55x31 TaxID=3042688 RepID=UPI002482225A|nr:hypothetical protein [Polyangium sp. y55x31]MDI1480832.1 hypothetical protein [Polyangium sp. y55x31]
MSDKPENPVQRLGLRSDEPSCAPNPFDRFDLDPREGPRAITERLRELAEDAGEAERASIRAAWEELTLHPLRRLRAAIGARPRHPALDRTGPEHAPPKARKASAAEPVGLGDLAPRPSVALALASFLSRGAERGPRTVLSLDEDPVLAAGAPSADPAFAPTSPERKR